MPKPWRYIFLTLIASVLLVFLAAFSLADSRLHLVFCDVGQGDAALIYRGSTQILIDGGPDSSVISCLSSHMPFWDRKIEIVTMTHPQEDHYGGLVDVVRRYRVDLFVAPGIDNNTAGFRTLKKEIEDRKISEAWSGRAGLRVMNPKTGDILRNGAIQIDTIWPAGEWISMNTESRIENLESRILGAATAKVDLNEFSIVQKVSYGDFDALLTGDIEPPVTETIADLLEGRVGIEVLKVPHHGSKNGLTEKLLKAVSPKLAVISVGKKNRYGHPHKETLKLLSEKAIKLYRTDLDGEVEVVTDGKKWWIR